MLFLIISQADRLMYMYPLTFKDLMPMKRIAHISFILAIILTAFDMSIWAQKNEIISSHIASLQVTTGEEWQEPPIKVLGDRSPIYIDFDDMTHEYHRYAYKLEHCDADWSTSDQLFQSDYTSGIAENIAIDDAEESVNTNTQYTHYRLTIPNDNFSIKMSGNYRLTVFDDNSDEIIFKAYFLVVEPLLNVSITVSTNTDIDVNNSHQQIGMDIKYNNLSVSNPDEQIKTVILQNFRWDNCKVNIKPDYKKNDGLQWIHNRDLIFNAGNEYHKFEMVDVDHPTMGIENMDWNDNEYNAYLWANEPRLSYVYDKDANGAFYIRNRDDVNSNTESEYINVHFFLKSPHLNGDVFINGAWTNDQLTEPFKMKWDEEKQVYSNTMLLKQGYYSYQYVLVNPDGESVPVPSDGNFYQTENKYYALVYYHGNGERTDRLVGYSQVETK